MVVRTSGEIESESSADDDMPELEDCNDKTSSEGSVEEPVKGDLFINRRVDLPNTSGSREQREQIFHTRCKVQDQVCSMIIDSGSCTNVVSSLLVEKLHLPTLKHPDPYTLQWLNECGEVKVKK